MDLRTIEYYLAVVEEGSITRAAERLHMSQPPLTVRLRTLESELGVQLLTRHGRGVEPTAAGRVFAERARRLLVDVQATTDAVRSIGEGVSGALTLAVAGSVAPGLVASLLRELRAQAPDVTLSVVDGTENAVRDRVRHLEADAGLLHLGLNQRPERRRALDLETAVAAREPLMAVLPAGHPVSTCERADVTMLTSETLVAPSRAAAPSLHERLLATWQASGGNPGHVREIDSMVTVLALVEAGAGVSVLPAAVASIAWPGLVALPLLQHHPAVETAIVWRPDSTSPVVRRFLRIALATPEPDALDPEHARQVTAGA
jgi:DNA-binding transcriptional LysR family regulator